MAETQTAKKSTAKKAPAKKTAAKTKGGGVANVDLPAEIFDVQVNIPLIHQVVVAQQAAARQGTHSTKRRGEVRGGGRKPYKQKGTGRARQGSTRAPQFAGGGIVHGPKPRDYDQRTPKKMKAAALRGALSDRARNDRIHVLDSFGLGDAPSTRTALAQLASITDRTKFLVVLERTDAITWLSLRNAQQVHIVAVDQLNTYDVLASDDVVFTRGAYDAFVGGKASATESVPDAEVEAEARRGREEGRQEGQRPEGRRREARRRHRRLPRRRQGRRGRLGSRGLRDQGQRPVDEVPRPRWPLVRRDDRGVLVQDRRGRRGRRLHRGRQVGQGDKAEAEEDDK